MFLGPYIPDEAERIEFCDAYLHMVEGFLAFPISFPGSGLWKAIRGREKVIKFLMACCNQARARMATGAEPTCLLDFWAQVINDEVSDAEKVSCAFRTF